MNEQKQYELDLMELNRAIVSIGTDYSKNLEKLTEACGKILNADSAFYQRLKGRELRIEGEWKLSASYIRCKDSEGHLCADIIRSAARSRPQVHVILPKLCHFHQPCYQNEKGELTYIGYPVFAFNQSVGLLCSVFSRKMELNDEQRNIMDILAKAIGIEEERREYEEMIKERETVYRLLFDFAPDAIEVLDADGNILDCNAAHEKLMGQGYTEIVGKNVVDLIPEHGKEKFRAMMDEAVEKGFIEWESNHRFAPDIPAIPVWRKMKALYTLEGKYRGCVIFNRDMSDHKKAEAARLKQERFEGVLETAGAACHELNQPLQAILGYVDLLLKHIPEEHPSRKWATHIKEQVERFAVITRRLNTITRYEVQDYLCGTKIIDLQKASEAG